MLRTQILQSMDMRAWQFLGITSATEGCGKSVVAINLALSIARQPGRSVLLVDLDLQKPQVANYLGLNCDRGIVERFGRSNKSAGRPCSGAHPQRAGFGSALRGAYDKFFRMDCFARNELRLLQEIKRDFRNWTVIFDLPPILSSDDVISILPRLDCVAFVVGAGTTTAEEIKECNKHLESAEIVRVILNKSEDTTAAYYYSYARPTTGRRKDQNVAEEAPQTAKGLSAFRRELGR